MGVYGNVNVVDCNRRQAIELVVDRVLFAMAAVGCCRYSCQVSGWAVYDAKRVDCSRAQIRLELQLAFLCA
jgi:hypothetical protein